MANRLLFEVGLDGSGFSRGIQDMQALAARAGSRVQSSLAGDGIHGGGGALRESLVLTRELMRGNYTRVPGSLMILLDRLGLLKLVINDNVTASELLAQKLEKEAVVAALAAEKAAQDATAKLAVFEADKMATEAMAEEAITADANAVALRNAALAADAKAVSARRLATAEDAANGPAAASITTFGVVAIVLVAAAAAAYFLWKHIHALNESASTLRRWYDLTPTFRESADAMQKAADIAERYREKIDEINKSHETLGHRLEAQSRLLKERQQLEKQLAQEQGKSKAEMLALDMRQLQAEKALEEAHAKQLQTQVHNDQIAAENATAAAAKAGGLAAIEAREKAEKYASELRDALEAKMSTDAGLEKLIEMKSRGVASVTRDIPFGPGGENAGRSREVTDSIDAVIAETKAQLSTTKYWVDVGGKKIYTSFADASKEYDSLAGSTEQLRNAQKHLEKIADEAAHGLQVDNDDLKKTLEKIRQLGGQIDLHKQFDPLLAFAGRGKTVSDSLVSTGNFLGSASGQIGGMEQRKIDLMERMLRAINEIKHGGAMSNFAGQDVQYPVA